MHRSSLFTLVAVLIGKVDPSPQVAVELIPEATSTIRWSAMADECERWLRGKRASARVHWTHDACPRRRAQTYHIEIVCKRLVYICLGVDVINLGPRRTESPPVPRPYPFSQRQSGFEDPLESIQLAWCATKDPSVVIPTRYVPWGHRCQSRDVRLGGIVQIPDGVLDDDGSDGS